MKHYFIFTLLSFLLIISFSLYAMHVSVEDNVTLKALPPIAYRLLGKSPHQSLCRTASFSSSNLFDYEELAITHNIPFLDRKPCSVYIIVLDKSEKNLESHEVLYLEEYRIETKHTQQAIIARHIHTLPICQIGKLQ